MKLVLIVWEDATSLDTGPWVEKQEWKYSPCIVHEVGFIIHEDENGIILTNAYNEDQTGPVTQIPRGMIREVTHLE